MKTILRYVRLYILIGAQVAKARMSYRVDFIVTFIGALFWSLPSFFSIVVILGNIPSLAGWSLEELVFLYGFYELAMWPNGLFFQRVWGLPWEVQSGGFIKYYFRPLNMMFYFMSEIVYTDMFIFLPIPLGLLIWSSIRLGIVWDAVRIVGGLCLLFSASLIVDALMIAAASTAFWLTNSHSLLELTSRIRENARYPLTIYNLPVRIVFSVILPLGFVAFYPVQWILRPHEAGIIPFLTPVVGVACFAASYLVWHMGTRKWSGTGT
jgi:ABC-2 type transport system permease protein